MVQPPRVDVGANPRRGRCKRQHQLSCCGCTISPAPAEPSQVVRTEQSISCARRIAVARGRRYVRAAMTSSELERLDETTTRRLDGTVVIVTGGASGLGRLYCENLVREGARVVVADLDEESAESFARAVNEEREATHAVAVGADVTSERDAERIAQAAVDAFGRIDVLINNAGTYPHLPFDQMGYEDWRLVMSVNLDSVFLCSRAVLGQMKAQGAGKIVNVATNLVWIGLAN